jgi:hypothetical protein
MNQPTLLCNDETDQAIALYLHGFIAPLIPAALLSLAALFFL